MDADLMPVGGQRAYLLRIDQGGDGGVVPARLDVVPVQQGADAGNAPAAAILPLADAHRAFVRAEGVANGGGQVTGDRG